MNNRDILIGADPDARLDTGMKVKEALSQTEQWWNRVGRREMVELSEHQKKAIGTSFATLDPDDSNYLPSGIINGVEWHLLTKREKLSCVKVWHHFNVRMQDVIGSEQHQYKFGQRKDIQ